MAPASLPTTWERRAEVVGRAEELRARLEPLADADAEAYGAFMAERSDENVERIVAIPFELAEAAAEVAELAALVASDGNPNVSGDAAAGADLAAAAASIAARLVAINARAGDERVQQARELAARAASAAARDVREGHVLGTVPGTRPNRTMRFRRAARRRASTPASRAGAGRS